MTIDEVARRAGIGKGTVYLYWPSKIELFGAAFTRDALAALDAQGEAIRADPGEVLLSRSSRRTFLGTMRSPLSRALVTGDREVLGDLLTTSAASGSFGIGKVSTTTQALEMLHRHGLLREDPAKAPTLAYRVSATTSGFYAIDDTDVATQFDLETRADALEVTLRRAFEPDAAPSPRALNAAAAEALDFYQLWRDELATALDRATKEENI